MNKSISGYLLVLSIATVLLAGCGSSSGTKSANGTGTSGSGPNDLNAPLLNPEDAAKLDPNFKPPEFKPEDMQASDLTMAMSQGMSAGAMKNSVGGKRIFILGKVVERSADDAENVNLTLTGYKTHQGKQLLLKCKFATTERDAVNKVKVDEEVRVEGMMDGDLNEDVLEFKDCVLAPKEAEVKEKDAEK